MTGRDTLVALRSRDELRSLKVMMFSTTIPDHDKRFFKTYHADYLVKPSTMERWFHAIQEKIAPLMPSAG